MSEESSPQTPYQKTKRVLSAIWLMAGLLMIAGTVVAIFAKWMGWIDISWKMIFAPCVGLCGAWIVLFLIILGLLNLAKQIDS